MKQPFDLLRNCIHNSHVLTGLEIDNGVPVRVVKKAFDARGASQLCNEKSGLEWYCSRAGIPRTEWLDASTEMDRVNVLSYRYVSGQVGNCHAGLAQNEARVRQVIEYYAKVFKGGGRSHGDLSLGNIVFSDDQVTRIIDWENFNDTMPPEYDLVYLVTELVLFAFTGRRSVGEAERALFRSLLSAISAKLPVSNAVAKSPASWCRIQAAKYALVKGVDHDKCPFIAATNEVILTLDDALGI